MIIDIHIHINMNINILQAASARFNLAEATATLDAAKQVAAAAAEDPPKTKRKAGSPATKDGAALESEVDVKTEPGLSGDEAKDPAAASSASAPAAAASSADATAASSASVAAASGASDDDDDLNLNALFGDSDEEGKDPAADGWVAAKAAPLKPVKAKAKPKLKPHKAVAAPKEEDPAGLPADEKDQEMERPWEVGDIVKVSCKKDAKIQQPARAGAPTLVHLKSYKKDARDSRTPCL